jgi:hypothetical protein
MAALAAKISDATHKQLAQALDAVERIDDERQKKVFAAFPDPDPRRIFSDTVLGFAAAELSDLSQKLGQADPFSRLARRLSLWFKPSQDYSRYGIPLPNHSRAIADAAIRLIELVKDENTDNVKRLLRIWSGAEPIEASRGAIVGIRSLLSLCVIETSSAF